MSWREGEPRADAAEKLLCWSSVCPASEGANTVGSISHFGLYSATASGATRPFPGLLFSLAFVRDHRPSRTGTVYLRGAGWDGLIWASSSESRLECVSSWNYVFCQYCYHLRYRSGVSPKSSNVGVHQFFETPIFWLSHLFANFVSAAPSILANMCCGFTEKGASYRALGARPGGFFIGRRQSPHAGTQCQDYRRTNRSDCCREEKNG